MLTKTRGTLLECGVFVHRSDAEMVVVGPLLVMRSRWSVMDLETGYFEELVLDIPIVERKGMPADKAALAATTTGITYFLRDLLMLPRGDEDEIDAADDGRFEPLDRAVAAAARELAPVEVRVDTRLKAGAAGATTLADLAASPVAPPGAVDLWCRGATSWLAKKGVEKVITRLEDVPAEFAAMILGKYRADHEAWRKERR